MQRKDITDEMVCRACAEAWDLRVFTSDVLEQWTGAPEKVIYAAMDRADDRGLIEYGVSLRSAWLTEKGMELIATSTPRPPLYLRNERIF